MASLQSRLSDLITAIGNDFKRHHGVSSNTTLATLTPSATVNQFIITAQAGTLAIANPTPANIANGQSLIIRVKDNGTAKSITWDTYYRAVGVTLPNTTVAGKITYIGAKWNAAETKFDVIAISQEA